MTARLRRLWLRVHRWLALSVGWILAAVALMGAVLVVANPLDQRLHPELFRARGNGAAHAVTLEAVRARLLAEFGKDTTLTFLPPRTAGATLAVRVRARWNGTVYIDPAGGAEQGRRGETEGVRNLVFTLHSSLGLQDTGKAVLATIALAYLVLLLTARAAHRTAQGTRARPVRPAPHRRRGPRPVRRGVGGHRRLHGVEAARRRRRHARRCPAAQGAETAQTT
jgi:uncharacterized iron-regulated membrane protein